MRRPLILALALTAPLLAGCATSVDVSPPAPIAAPVIPNVPPDVLACASAPVTPPDSNLSAGDVEKLWKTDRAKLAKVNACLHRLICEYQDVRRDIGKVDTAACEPEKKASKPKKPSKFFSLFHGTKS